MELCLLLNVPGKSWHKIQTIWKICQEEGKLNKYHKTCIIEYEDKKMIRISGITLSM